MIRKYWVILLLCSGFFSYSELYSAADSLTEVKIEYYDLIVKLRYDKNNFFTGSLEVQKKGETVFAADSIYSDYFEHSTVDLDGDGSKELLISLGTGATPYIYNDLLIFDITRSNEPLFSIQNADVVQKEKQTPKISVYVRMSPSVLGIGYNWLLEYKNKKMLFYKAEDQQWLGNVTPDEKETLETIKSFSDNSNPCGDRENYLSYYEAFLLQSKIAGDEEKGLDFFDEHYKCKSKSEALKIMKNNVSDSYKWIIDTNNYKYVNE
jgi:hypothetical protein